MPTIDVSNEHAFQNAKQMGSPDFAIESEPTALDDPNAHLTSPGSAPIHGRQTATSSKGTTKTTGDKQSATIIVSPEMKMIGGLILLLLFLVFVLLILWDRYGKQVSELYTSNQSFSAEECDSHGKRESAQSKKQRRTGASSSNQLKDDFSMYRRLPTFFYEYSRQSKKPKSHEL
uniref:AlNc14C16G1733 protein n=1 Tax=Albugo laibachii Nc14 TaxID=890382 RepID=F0W450_9STRA|nr:AlNc14C16G1733 [Albugo laibachii Nc14]CCA27408.1 AlNc14C528G12053 [Albugo laibachii Nc14]|eukprot:CCA27408.1 AlNc14C528G12053 [Albugo laibachii Nc14]